MVYDYRVLSDREIKVENRDYAESLIEKYATLETREISNEHVR